MFALGVFVGLVVGVLATVVWAASVPRRASPAYLAMTRCTEDADQANARFQHLI